jgi:hypothetical protein
VSLSDNLKPWPVIERRLDAAAQAGFVIALYNPISQARPWQLATAFERLRGHLPATTPTVFGRAVGRADESIVVATLAAADPACADMATLVIVGSAETRVVPRPGPRAARLYAPFDRERARMIEPGHGVLDGLDGRRLRQSRTAQQDHRETERARRRQLAVGRGPAAVLGDDDVDRVRTQQCAIICFGKGPTPVT